MLQLEKNAAIAVEDYRVSSPASRTKAVSDDRESTWHFKLVIGSLIHVEMALSASTEHEY